MVAFEGTLRSFIGYFFFVERGICKDLKAKIIYLFFYLPSFPSDKHFNLNITTMTYRNYTSIPYPFLYDAALVISKRYALESIYMDKEGGICITLAGKLSDNAVKDILQNINPNDVCKNSIELSPLDYSYSDDMQRTYVYSGEGIDYRTLKAV